ncbi:MAG: hypothetical protein ACR2FV_08075 [Ornithinimicrobium sp.]|jgi:hypothetical protein|uniref:hypothetical protein n=1 Tax=Ornithinimicrobium sp. TaxID=1977084 RepID=UPI003D9BBE20
MDAAWLGLAGVIVGVAGTLLVTWINARAAAAQARQARQERRMDDVRQLAVEGYLAAVEAVGWLSTMHVEDSVDPQFAAEYSPKTDAAIAKLEEARRALGRVAGLGGSKELAEVAQETFSALIVLADAWRRAQEYRRRFLPGSKFEKAAFDREYARLDLARERICGFAGELPSKEIDQGQVLEGSLLYRLRQATISI